MTDTYDTTTNEGLVRLLCTDSDPANRIFTDAQIADFLTLNSHDVLYAAAQALDVIASTESLVQKRIRLLDLQTDGPAVAADLRKAAAELRRQAEQDGAFDWAEMVTSPATARERWRDDLLRAGV